MLRLFFYQDKALTTMALTERHLCVMDMRGCGWIPCSVSMSQPIWSKYRERLEDVVLRHPKLFPSFQRGTVKFDEFGNRRKGNILVDPWDCVWSFEADGLQGQVVKHPLENWNSMKDYKLPNPDHGIVQEGGREMTSWESIEHSVDDARRNGMAVGISLGHGFFYLRLTYIRGFVNLMRDIATDSPELHRLIEMMTEYYLQIIERILTFRPDIVYFGDDLGMQDRMPMSETKFREFIYPSYRKFFRRLRDSGVRVHLHTDGHVMEVTDSLLEAGVSILNVQDLVNGLDNIVMNLKGRVCVDLDIDRQRILPYGTREMIFNHIRDIVLKLGSKEGGLMLTSGIYPHVPLGNIDALCEALELYMNYYEAR